ncbi:hypothetical protein N9J64_00165 [bacterium]|nr:hypothetical protein [bacterium]
MKAITKNNIVIENFDEYCEGNYFYEDVAVKYDLQNGKINTIAFCICKKTAEDMAKSLNLYDNIEEELG